MRLLQAAAGGAVFLLAAAAAAQQWEEPGPDLDSFYGKRSFQLISVGAAPYLLPNGGTLEEVSFAFNTLSRRTQPKHWRNYYGAALNFGAGQDIPYDFNSYGPADLDIWYACLLIQSKLFYSDRARIRPFLGFEGGGGFGGVILSGLDPDVNGPRIPNLSLVRLGVEGGVQIALGERLALVISDTASAYLGIIERDQFYVFPNTLYVGVVFWKGLPEAGR